MQSWDTKAFFGDIQGFLNMGRHASRSFIYLSGLARHHSFSSVQHQLHALYMASPPDFTWPVSLSLEATLYGVGFAQISSYLTAHPTDMLSVKCLVSKSILDVFLGLTLARSPSCAALRSSQSSPSETLSIVLWRRPIKCSSLCHRTFGSSRGASGSSKLN
jgi:hypothetical protein